MRLISLALPYGFLALVLSLPGVGKAQDSIAVDSLSKPYTPPYDSSCITGQDKEEYTCQYFDHGSTEIFSYQTFRNGKVIKMWNMGPAPSERNGSNASMDMSFLSMEWSPFVPKAWRGFRAIGAVRFNGRWLGGYLQGFSHEPVNESNSYDHLSKNPFGDTQKGKHTNIQGLSAGVAYPANTVLVLTGGVGVWNSETYQEFYDGSGILGDRGQYYTPDKSETLPYFQIGCTLLIAQRVTVGISADAPVGVTLSVGYNVIKLFQRKDGSYW